MEGTVDCDDISLGEHILERFDSATANFLFGLSVERLVIKVEEFLAVEGYQTSQDTFTDTADTDGGNDLAFDIKGVLCDLCDVPSACGNLFVGGDKVADESEHCENDYLYEHKNQSIGPNHVQRQIRRWSQ